MAKNIIIGVLAVAIAAMGIVVYKTETRYIASQKALEEMHDHSFQALDSAVRDLALTLAKCMVADGQDYLAMAFSQAASQASTAQEMLARLPISHAASTQTFGYLSKTEDFSSAMLRKVLDGDEITAEDRESAKALEKTARTLNDSLSLFKDEMQEMPDGFKWLDHNVGYLAGAEESAFTKQLTAVDESLEGFPPMVYDGALSEHLKDAAASGISGAAMSKDQAQRLVNGVDGAEITFLGERDSAIPAYCFQAGDGKSTRTFYFSKQGGHLISSSSSDVPTKTVISIEQAREKAVEFLKKAGLPEMSPTSYECYDNIAMFCFCSFEGGVKAFTDAVKVQVSLEDGKIIGFESSGFYMNNRRRAPQSAAISEAEAISMLASGIDITEISMALVPSKGMKESLCYELSGKIGDESFAIYVDAMTGKQRQINRINASDSSLLYE
ncbi:MAG: germination protein YpeB [Eubacteriaceae bacterium]|nr:germination protein YpeB [Eubacteriaceae bacterium]